MFQGSDEDDQELGGSNNTQEEPETLVRHSKMIICDCGNTCIMVFDCCNACTLICDCGNTCIIICDCGNTHIMICDCGNTHIMICDCGNTHIKICYCGNTRIIFSSPEHEVLMVSYCGQWLSVVRRPSCVNI